MQAFTIQNDKDLDRAVRLVEQLWDAEPESENAQLLDVMSFMIDTYEAKHSRLPEADPINLIQFKLKELGWSQRRLARELGWGSGRVSEILNRKRRLTLNMVQALSKILDLPPGILLEGRREGHWVLLDPHSHKIAMRLAQHHNVATILGAALQQYSELLMPQTHAVSCVNGESQDVPPNVLMLKRTAA